jgi:tetratricopeptide (TPR) repeat protein
MAQKSPLPFGSRDPRQLLRQAVEAHRSGRLVEAERLYRAALELHRGIADAHQLLATVLLAQRRAGDALASIRRALKLDDRRAAFHDTHGNVQFALEQFGRARDAYRRAIELDPEAPAPRFGLGLALDRLGDLPGAIEQYRAGVVHAPTDPRLRINLGEALLRSGELGLAIAELSEATRLAPGQVAAWMNLARAHRDRGEVDAAVRCCEAALRIEPDQAQVLTSLGQVLREAGRAEEAEQVLRRAIAVAPEMPEPRITLAMTRRHRERDAEVAWIEAAAAAPEAVTSRPCDLLFAQAKILDDLGEHEAAFAALERANAARRATFEYSIPDAAAQIARIREVFTAERCAVLRDGGCTDPTPILVVGMPRSGTSLVEQILSSHPEVHGAGETMSAVTAVDGLPGGYPEAFADIDRDALQDAGNRYVELLRAMAPPGVARIVDKLPMNFARLGALRAMLPRATLIHCVRDPRDTCLSIFRQNFEHDLGYAFDLVEAGRFHRLHDELMEHWREVLGPDAFLDLVYEDLVEDLEGGVRRILEHCGLAFDPACLDFHRTARSVRTASLQQVRRPIYSSSVGGWRRYEQQLRPLLEVL